MADFSLSKWMPEDDGKDVPFTLLSGANKSYMTHEMYQKY